MTPSESSGHKKKTDERCVPLHPGHLSHLNKNVRDHFIFKEGSAATFDITDTEIAVMSGGLASRREILSSAGSVIAFKPILTLDVRET
jgi:N5-(carboxyethyl)ornithine synthase